MIFVAFRTSKKKSIPPANSKGQHTIFLSQGAGADLSARTNPKSAQLQITYCRKQKANI